MGYINGFCLKQVKGLDYATQKMPLWHMRYLKLKAIEYQQMQKEAFSELPYLSKAKTSINPLSREFHSHEEARK